MRIVKSLKGNTVDITWVSSGVTPTDIFALVYNGSETLVHSATMSSSGNGHYYNAFTIPNSRGFYSCKTTATINSNPYIRNEVIEATDSEVD